MQRPLRAATLAATLSLAACATTPGAGDSLSALARDYVVLQMAIGETQYRTHLPWWLVLVHVTLAATVWAVLTAFVYSLWRPRRMV